MALYHNFFLLLITCWMCSYSTSGLLEPARRPSCNQTLTTLQQLQEATLNSITQSLDYILCVDLAQSASPLQISYSAAEILYASVIITGNSSVVRCKTPPTSGQLPLSDYTQFPLIFTNSSLVIVEGVHFEGCMRPLKFNWVTRVELTSSSFRDFYPGGAVEISNSPQVIVSGCKFTNNTSLGIGVERYSGNAGAIAVGYNDRPRPEYLRNNSPVILISESTFESNNATATEAFQYALSEVLSQRLYNQRGGSIACYFGTPSYSVTVNVTGSTIKNSFARDSGGGVYMFLAGDDNAHTVNIWNTDFIGNEALDGGGLEITQSTPDSLTRPNRVTVSGCNFVKNVGNFGGGFKSIQLDTNGNMNFVTVRNASFSENEALVGSGLYLQSLYAIDTVKLEKRIIVKDCTFMDNIANRGALFIIRNTVGIQGNTTFERNIGPGLRVVGGLAVLGGNILFSENSHDPEGFSGALHLSSFGQITLQKGTNITFTNNSGIDGASIVVIGQLISAGFTEQLYNPQCFLQYEDPRVPPPSWEVKLVFRGNRAAIGPVIYASDVDVCEWHDARSPFFEDIQESWTFMEMSNNYLLRGASEFDLPDYYIQTVAHSIWLPENKGISAAPGDNIAVNVVALDEFRHNTTAFLELSTIQGMNADQVVFTPSIVQTVAGVGQIEFKYLSNTLTGNTTVRLTPTFITEQETSGDLTLLHDLCLPGYFLMDRECVCEETGTVALCDLKRRGILLADGLWGAPPNWSRELVTYVCPPGYCNCTRGFEDVNEDAGCLLEYDDPFAICHNTRKGLLCGQCKEGYGVGLLTNNCKRFTDIVPQFWLFPIYLGVVIPLLVIIVKFGVHLPTILRGFIFYVQISPIAVEFLSQNFNLRVDVMSCIASTLALYVPYDFNFHEGMTSLESYGLRYVTPLVALIVVPIAARVRRPHTKYWHGVWTIIQIMYIMVIDTSVSLLLCPTLTSTTSSGTSKLTLWFYDGSVQCYHGWHILLAIVALLSLLALGLVVPLIATALYFKYFRRKLHLAMIAKLEPFSFALAKGFKEKYRWWPVMDMACRYLFVVIVVSAVGKKIVPLLLSLVLFIIQFYVHPYEDSKANYLESFVLFALVIFLGLGSTTSLIRVSHFRSNFTLWPLFYLPLAVGAVVATLYIAYQTWRWLLEHNKFEFLEKKTKRSKRAQTFLRRFTVSRRTWLVHQESITQSEVSIFDDRRKTVVNKIEHTEQTGTSF